MRIRTGHSKDVDISNFYNKLTGTLLDRKNYAYIEVYKDAAPVGCIIYCDYTGRGISMHVHLPNMLTKSVIRKMFEYPFKELNVDRLFIEFALVNEKVRNIADRLGFYYSASVENYYGNHNDKIIMVAEYNDIKRWLK